MNVAKQSHNTSTAEYLEIFQEGLKILENWLVKKYGNSKRCVRKNDISTFTRFMYNDIRREQTHTI